MEEHTHRANAAEAIVRPSAWGELLLWVALAAFTIFHITASIAHSLKNGRLALSTPLFDDVSYLVDGLARLDSFERHGLSGLLASFPQNPPHAPLLSILSTLGFALFDGELGAYVLSGIWVIAVLGLVAHIMRKSHALARAGVLLAILSLPILNTVVGVFRPDIAWGLLTGASATLLATTDIAQASWRKLALLGLLVGISLISKPTGMPAGVAVMGTAYVGGIATAYARQRAGSIRPIVNGTLLIVLGAAIISAPYYWVAAHHVLNYIRNVMVEQRAIWQENMPLKEHLTYLFQPYLLSSMLGWLWPAGILVVAANGFLCAWRSATDREPFLHFLTTAALLAVAYLIPALSPVKNAYIGCLFYGAAIMVFVWNLAQLLERVRIAPWIVAISGLAIFVLFWRPANIHTTLDSSMRAAGAAHQAIMPSVLKLLASKESAGPPPKLLVASVGPLFDTTIRYAALKHSLDVIVESDVAPPSWEALADRAARADIIIVAETGTLGQSGAPFPLTKIQDRLLISLDGNSQFKPLVSHVDTTGHRTVVFAKPFIASQVRTTFAAGFREQEGPFHPLRLKSFRWFTQNEARIVLSSDQTAKAAMHIRCIAIVDTRLTVATLDGTDSQVVDLSGGFAIDNFKEISLALLFDGKPQVIVMTANPRQLVPATFPSSVLCETPLRISPRP